MNNLQWKAQRGNVCGQEKSQGQRLFRPVSVLQVLVVTLGLTAASYSFACTPGLTEAVAISAEFIEGAPIDKLVIRNESAADWRIVSTTWDLSTSTGKVFFDVTDSGAGVEVFQPFKVIVGAAKPAELKVEPMIKDGDQSLSLQFASFSSSESFTMSVDVDDQLGKREITVSDSEMQGASISFELTDLQGETRQASAVFDSNAMAKVCLN